MLRFGVLGPLAVWTASGEPVAVAERKVRALLADLLVHVGQPVSASRLIDDLWGEQLPENPTSTLQTRVSQLRRALAGAAPEGRELVAWQPPGYLLRAAPEAVDAGQFRALVGRARAAGDPQTRAARLADALALWRGPAYADFAHQPFARAAIDRLTEEWLAAREEQAQARLALGEHTELIGELGSLVTQHPLRQRLRSAYMLALYRAGRHGEALETYGELRDQLADQLGLDPDAELTALRQAILRQEPRLAAPPAEPCRSAAPSNNLPTPLTNLVGREEAVAEVRSRLAADRLVTLTGPGGVGKTRLAVEVAHQLVDGYDDGVWLIELATIEQRAGAAGPASSHGPGMAAGLVRLISTALRLDDRALGPAEDVDELVDALAEVLREQRSLLVLDNCEHVIGPVASLTALLLRAAPGLRVLATSREPLGIPGEVRWEVAPLALPDPTAREPTTLATSSAVQLFVARAAAATAGFRLTPANADAVAGICQRLDGIPLALELAATRVNGLGVHEVASRLDDRFRLLSAGLRGVPARQQTLQAVIGWSWGLLAAAERAVLRRLALHPDSFTSTAAEAICADHELVASEVPQLLARLVDRSLVVRVEGPAGIRYRLLESVGAYGLEQLHAAGEFTPVLQRHIAYYTGLSTETEPSLYGHGPLFEYLREVPEQPAATPAAPPPATSTIHTVRSSDGTLIAYEQSGAGSPVVLVGGALNDRSSFAPLVTWLASRFTVVTYDRRGRGASGDNPPYAVARELEDLHAIVRELDEPVYAVGFSSGAVLAVEAALAEVDLAGLALIEPPFILDGSRKPMPADFVDQLDRLVAAGRRGDAVELFLTEAVEMPVEIVAPMRSAPTWAALEAVAHTIRYDLAAMGDFRPPARWAALPTPVLVITGTESARWRQHAAKEVAQLFRHGRHRILAGRSHEAAPEVIGPILAELFSPG
ncbi:alpha/beta fold hydrolase [Natronosporangium hydrolyticum]|uniref:Alpha/beta fold hydrolase n=1 Tax=Natronosporangium hydrolyticum TaxID=2811111 RepID=A0A895YS43_9ACTN|nr:alpha/beta fold hydrolase [Natronosporangium hydrolyticum]QSB16838.1 alpha/beta fold hydrolase [Natronosporangium hydrolyticum]